MLYLVLFIIISFILLNVYFSKKRPFSSLEISEGNLNNEYIMYKEYVCDYNIVEDILNNIRQKFEEINRLEV